MFGEIVDVRLVRYEEIPALEAAPAGEGPTGRANVVFEAGQYLDARAVRISFDLGWAGDDATVLAAAMAELHAISRRLGDWTSRQRSE